ncbi:NAD(P)/FAD-dependent oxidoreductase [Tahibacter amnicola]|uniref:NAD(P)/FAD-dependent oxidoreductase n=1 Tax=Tahibacter amnicola TaxID=2976241 RepID=A0ABY6BBP5_9GAMM|nr:FAD/NAD(P)-binding oxidoreductase [Tahibacter amnicola]UXI67232.1 NAD(P)/FAD-dependent oxidoreductase [Tahibacter amnicola]
MPRCHAEVLVIGAGPAGIAAAVTAERAGARAVLVDMQAEPGGQIWRGQWRQRKNPAARQWMEALERSPTECRFGSRLIAVPERGTALFDSPEGALTIQYERVVVATGARELLLPYPGWTLPGVFGAGGLQVLVKNGWPVQGRRVVIGGTGPLLLAVADTLRAHGANVVCIAEQAPLSAVASFGVGLAGNPGKLAQAFGLGWRLRGARYRTSSWVTRVHGKDAVDGVTVRQNGRLVDYACDAVATGYGLVPNLDVGASFGCEWRDGAIWVDANQHTSVAGVYCAGEGTGIGGVDQALTQGQMAGNAAAGRADLNRELQQRRNAEMRFAGQLRTAFRLRDEIRQLAEDSTVLCRCENVSVGAVRSCASAREAKLQHRLGMGHCQGRVCGGAASYLFGWSPSLPRPPLAPVAIGNLDYSSFSQSLERTV